MADILEARIKELVDTCKAITPNTPEWYIQMCVEKYIKEEEPHLLEVNGVVVIEEENTSANDKEAP